MYEYSPKTPRKKEILLSVTLFGIGAVLFAVSQIPDLPFPALFQLAMLVFFTAGVMVLSLCVLRHYVYRIAPRDTDAGDGPPDFTITEYYGRRVTVVCRVSLRDIEDVTPVTPQNRVALSASLKGKRVYRYTSELFDAKPYLVTVADGEDRFYLRIAADEAIFLTLKREK